MMGRKEKIVSAENNSSPAIGTKMRLARAEKGISLTEMSRLISYTKSRLSTVENGNGKPSQELVQAYEQVLGLVPGTFQTGLPVTALGHRYSPLPNPVPDKEIISIQEGSFVQDQAQKNRFSSQEQHSVAPPSQQLPYTTRTERREDIEEVPKIGSFYGRKQELAQLLQWIEEERCRIVTLQGIGGIGKTMLACVLEERIREYFDFVFWRTLQNAPPPEKVFRDCINFLSGQSVEHLEEIEDIDELTRYLERYLQKYRCLIVLDNVETILESGQNAGNYRSGYEGYGKLITAFGNNEYRGCLLLTTRELPFDIVELEGLRVKTFPLAGVGLEEGRYILREKDLIGTDEICNELIQKYAGNPLALKLVSGPIREIFGGEIAEFLAEPGVVVGDIYGLIHQQFGRLSALEREVIYWFALACEPITFNDVLKKIVRPIPKREILDALDSLRRRSMLDNSSGSLFTLQPVIMEYVTDNFVAKVCKEIEVEQFALLPSHSLIRAEAKDYVRNNQMRLFLEPIARQLLSDLGKMKSEAKLKDMLAVLRETRPHTPEYTAGNLLNLLIRLGIDLTGYDFSHLAIWNAYLQDVALPKVNFAYAELKQTVFSDTFGSVLSVAISPDGELFVAGTANSEVRLWNAHSSAPLGICQGHTDWVRSVAFSPDSKTVVSGCDDETVRLWDVKTLQCLKIFYGHNNRVRSVAFAPNGNLLASCSDDHTVRLWDAITGECLHTLKGHTSRVWSVAFAPNSTLVASGSSDRTIKLWDTETGECLRTFLGHKERVCSIAFSCDGTQLVSGSDDQVVYVWNIDADKPLRTLRGHTSRVLSVTWSFDGNTIASGGDDQTIRLWDVSSGDCLAILREHTNRVWSVAFSPDSTVLISGSDDQSIRMWNVVDGQCIKTLQGQSSRVRSVAFSPDSALLISGSDDRTVRVWQRDTGQCLKMLRGHNTWIYSVAFSPKNNIIASGSDDQTIRLWDVQTGYYLRTLGGHTNWVRSVAFSPDGDTLISGSDDQTVRLWQVSTGLCLDILQKDNNRVWSVAFGPDGSNVASGGEDQIVRIWYPEDMARSLALKGHEGRIRSVSFSPDGRLLASSSDDQTIRLWEVETGQCLQTLKGHKNWVWSVAFSPDSKMLISGGDDHCVRLWQLNPVQQLWGGYGHSKRIYSVAFSPDASQVASGSYDGSIKLWDVQSGTCVRTLRREPPYEHMNITNVTGLSSAQKVMLRTLGAVED